MSDGESPEEAHSNALSSGLIFYRLFEKSGAIIRYY